MYLNLCAIVVFIVSSNAGFALEKPGLFTSGKLLLLPIDSTHSENFLIYAAKKKSTFKAPYLRIEQPKADADVKKIELKLLTAPEKTEAPDESAD